MELAQIRLLEEFFDIRLNRARMIYGYSLGELTAGDRGRRVRDATTRSSLPLSMAADCVALAENVTMGVLFSRGPLLDFDEVKRLCLKINAEGQGVIGISSYPGAQHGVAVGTERHDRPLSPSRCTTCFRPASICARITTPGRRCTRRWFGNAIIPNRVGVLMHTLARRIHEAESARASRW